MIANKHCRFPRLCLVPKGNQQSVTRLIPKMFYFLRLPIPNRPGPVPFQGPRDCASISADVPWKLERKQMNATSAGRKLVRSAEWNFASWFAPNVKVTWGEHCKFRRFYLIWWKCWTINNWIHQTENTCRKNDASMAYIKSERDRERKWGLAYVTMCHNNADVIKIMKCVEIEPRDTSSTRMGKVMWATRVT